MKKNYTILLFSLFSILVNAQNFVSTLPANKNVLLEGIGGINCYFCAEGDAVAASLSAQHTSRMVWINIHAGIFAEPVGDEPDFRSSSATQLLQLSGLSIYPAGMLNRRIFSALAQNSGKPAVEPSNWSAAAAVILAEAAPVNVAARSEFNVSSRELRVIIETYYTATASTAQNRIFAALLLDSLEGPQEGATVYNPSALNNGKYMHRNVFFDFIGTGISITNTNSGSFRTDTIYYTVPADFNGSSFSLKSPKVAVWVAENDSSNVLNAAYSEMALISDYSNAAGLFSVEWDADFNLICGNSSSAMAAIENRGNSPIDSVLISYDILTGTAQGSFSIVLDSPLALGARTEIAIPNITNLNNSFNSVEFVLSDVNATANPIVNQVLTDIRQSQLIVSDSSNGVLNIRFDNYPNDIKWILTDETSGQIVLADSNFAVPNTLISRSFTAENGHCYALKITDRYGDGLCCGSGQGYYELKIGNLQIIRDDAFAFESGTKFVFQQGVIAVQQTADNFLTASLFPNPSKDFTNVLIQSAAEGAIKLSVYNVYGQMVSQRNVEVGLGENNLRLETSNFSPGVYMVFIEQGQHTRILKLAVADYR
jgi:hypothetical protein